MLTGSKGWRVIALNQDWEGLEAFHLDRAPALLYNLCVVMSAEHVHPRRMMPLKMSHSNSWTLGLDTTQSTFHWLAKSLRFNRLGSVQLEA